MTVIEMAIFQLSSKSYSASELSNILENHFSDLKQLDKAIQDTLVYLKAHNIINDARLAQDLALRYQHKGNQFIRNILKQRKINQEIIDKVLKNLGDETTRAWEEIKTNRLASFSNLSESSSAVVRFLSGRQFSEETISAVTRRLKMDKHLCYSKSAA